MVDTSVAYYRKARNGQAYVVSEHIEIPESETRNVHLKNPSGTEKSLLVTNLTVQSDGPYESIVKDSFSDPPSSGTALEIENVLLDAADEDNDGVAVANKNTTYTATSEHALGVGGSGEGGNAGGFASEHPPIIVQNGREFVVEVKNTDGGPHNYAISIVYVETPINGE